MSQDSPISFIPSEQTRELIKPAIELLASGQRAVLATLVGIEGNAPYPIGAQMLVSESGEFAGQITGGCAEQAIADHAVMALDGNVALTQRYGLDSPYFDIKLPCGSGIDVYFDTSLTEQKLISIGVDLEQRQVFRQTLATTTGEFTKTYKPSRRLVLLGQGPILERLACLALESGFDVLCVAQNVVTGQLLRASGLEFVDLSVGKDLPALYDSYTGVISLFHEHELELGFLSDALRSDVSYIGALGSRRTHAARRSALLAQGSSNADVARVHGPVGLNIGAATPAHIAVSILAQAIERMP